MKRSSTLKRKLSKIFTVAMSIIIICLTLTLADLFSSLITVGGFSFSENNISIPKYTLYAVCLSKHESKVVAEEEAAECKKQGGAGYVYLGNNFFVIASLYENKSDAEKVKNQLTEFSNTSSIEEIIINPITISSTLSSDEHNCIENGLLIFKQTFQKLYDLSVSIDTAVINEINARLEINEIGSKINTIQNNFSILFKDNVTTQIIAIKQKISQLALKINELVNCSTQTPLTSHIKNAYCETIFLYQSLANTTL